MSFCTPSVFTPVKVVAAVVDPGELTNNEVDGVQPAANSDPRQRVSATEAAPPVLEPPVIDSSALTMQAAEVRHRMSYWIVKS